MFNCLLITAKLQFITVLVCFYIHNYVLNRNYPYTYDITCLRSPHRVPQMKLGTLLH